jgi:hypothetical protein
VNYNDMDIAHLQNAALTTIPQTALQVKMQQVMKAVRFRRTEQCEECMNYDCPISGIPDRYCGCKMEASHLR